MDFNTAKVNTTPTSGFIRLQDAFSYILKETLSDIIQATKNNLVLSVKDK